MVEVLAAADQAIKRAETLVKKNFTPELEQELISHVNKLQESVSSASKDQEEKINERLGHLNYLIGIGHFHSKRYDQSLPFLFQGVTFWRSMKTPPLHLLENLLMTIAQCFEMQGNELEAEKYRLQAAEVRQELVTQYFVRALKSRGYHVELNARPLEQEQPIDIFAEKKSMFRKKRICIWFAMDEVTAESLTFIVQGYKKFSKLRVVYLLQGNPLNVKLPSDVLVINKPESLEIPD